VPTRELLLVIPVLAAAGCGNGAAPARSVMTTVARPAEVLKLEAAPSGDLRFDVATLEAQAGTITLLMRNPSAVPHNITVKGAGVYEQGKVVSNGGESRVTVKLKAGTYEFFCSVDAHEAAGMKGRLVVAPRSS
jgi:plastocyanin